MRKKYLKLFLPICIAYTAVAITASAKEARGETSQILEAETEAYIPARYDVRDEGKSPVVRSQGNKGTCWALTACSALEAAMMPEKDIVFSADHLSMSNSFEITQDEGGDYKMIMAYLSAWQGPVLEADDPYGDGETEPGLKAAAHVQEIRMYTHPEREELKKAILAYGAVQTSLYMEKAMADRDTEYYKEETGAFYCSMEHEETHDVLILGWDDDFSRENFSTEPANDGAWICQNTWGDGFGEDGIFYVSYDDANTAKRALAYPCIEDAGNYDRIYQTDECGWQAAAGYAGTDTSYMANVYTADQSESIEAVGFYSVGTDTDYEVYAVHQFADPSSFEKMEKIGSGHLDAKGFFTVEADRQWMVQEGERFAIIVRITTKGHEKVACVELRKDRFTQNVTLAGKEGYISRNGSKWENVEEIYKANVCLKVYTKLNGMEDTSENGS